MPPKIKSIDRQSPVLGCGNWHEFTIIGCDCFVSQETENFQKIYSQAAAVPLALSRPSTDRPAYTIPLI